jgi:hypothetical protein
MKTILALATLTLSLSVFANYQLSGNGKAVTCYAEDNISVTLNASRTTLKYTVEGESNGPQKITKVLSNGRDSVTYVSKELSLTLSNKGNSMLYSGDSEPTTFNSCK